MSAKPGSRRPLHGVHQVFEYRLSFDAGDPDARLNEVRLSLDFPYPWFTPQMQFSPKSGCSPRTLHGNRFAQKKRTCFLGPKVEFPKPVVPAGLITAKPDFTRINERCDVYMSARAETMTAGRLQPNRSPEVMGSADKSLPTSQP